MAKMSMMTVEIQLEEDAAQIYLEASAEKRQKLELLLSLWLREFEELPLPSLKDTSTENVTPFDPD